jgi:hypothetical protein
MILASLLDLLGFSIFRPSYDAVGDWLSLPTGFLGSGTAVNLAYRSDLLR